MSTIVCFIDGLGLTEPARAPWNTARLPTIRRLLGEAPRRDLAIETPRLLFRAIDATLGVAGLPQSGTGHTTLWTGQNAAALLGRHFPAYPAPSQRGLIAEHNLFRQALDRGARVALATVHRSPYWELVAARQQRATAVALAARAAGLELPGVDEWLAGSAVTWDITGAYLQRWGVLDGLPTITPAEAGRRLAALAREADLVHYECYLPDFVGHGRIEETAERVLEQIDEMIDSILVHCTANDSLLLVSDHGNLEEPEHQRHTLNPVPLLVVGPAAEQSFAARSISDVAGILLSVLGQA